MKEFSYTIQDKLGIHARPAGLLVKKANEFKSSVTIHKDAKTADAKKIFAVMSLGVKMGDNIKVAVSGVDEDTAFDELQNFFKTVL